MEKILSLIKEHKLFLILLSFLLLSFIYFILNIKTNKNNLKSKIVKNDIIKKEKTNEKVLVKEENKLVKVDIKGYVANPSVYEVDENSRVIDVINAAGGLKEDANTELINLSAKVKDEMTIIIYSNKQIKEYKDGKKEIIYVEVEKCPDKINDACINKEENSTTTNNNDAKISINNASEEELMQISGIGASKAKDIILYREQNGLFAKIEDIKNIKGIGDALYEKIKDNITV